MSKSSIGVKERRRFRRFPICLDVMVSGDSGSSRPYRVKDYCQSGIFLLEHRSGEAAYSKNTSPFAIGQYVEISADLNSHDGISSVRFSVKVIRLVEDGFGATFHPAEIPIFNQLQEHARHSPSSETTATGLGAAKSASGQISFSQSRLRDMLSRIARPSLNQLLTKLFDDAEKDFLEQGGKAATDRAAQQLFNDLSSLEKITKSLDSYFIEPLLATALQGTSGEPDKTDPEISSSQLSLVDQDDFDRWVEVAKLSSRLDDLFAERLHDLSRMLIQVIPQTNPARAPEVPFCPRQIAQAINDLSERLEFSETSHAVLFKTALRVLARELGNIYDELRLRLEESGVRLPGPQAVIGGKDVITAGRSPPTSSQAPPGTSATDQVDAQANLDSPERLAEVNATELLQMMQSLPQAQPGVSLSDALGQLAASRNGSLVRIDPGAREKVQFADGFLDIVRNGEQLPSETEEWLDAVQMPLAQAVLSDPALFQHKDHPAFQLLDQLEHLGMFLSGKPQSRQQADMRAKADELLRDLREGGGTVESLQTAADSLAGLVSRQSRDYQINVERLVRSCAGQDRLQRSRMLVREELDRRYGERLVPKLAVALLDVGWRTLLELEVVRNGEDSAEYRDNLSLFDTLVHRLGGEPFEGQTTPKDPDKLLADTENRLSSTSFDPLRRAEVVERLRQALLEVGAKDRHEFLDLVSFPATDEAVPTFSREPPRGILPEVWKQAMESVQTLQVGDEITLSDEAGTDLPLRLAWVSDIDSRLVLVNQQGVKAEQLSPDELARRISIRRARIREGQSSMLSDRVADQMLKSMEDRLAYQASHDPLTGLFNRVRFTGFLQQALDEGATGNKMLCWMDLDNFAVINNTCGYETGDQLLVAVARLMEQHFDGHGYLGHMGGDRFSILLENCAPKQGLALADDFRAAVSKLPFYWDGRTMPVSVSIGLVALADVKKDLNQLLQAADQALSAAKRSRGNQVYQYSDSDQTITRNQRSMEWAIQVNQALERGRLKLRCQKISPVDDSGDLHAHYEILLGVTDENGEMLPIGDFISAAEMFNRMAEVDRWVVRKVITWVAKRPEKTAELGGFAVNLSGHTMNDEGFPDFVRELFEITGAQPKYVSFEVTETLAISNLDRASTIVKAMKDLGCAFALDDFGSGHSSYSYLKALPVDYLKIDGAFVKDLKAGSNDYAVVRSINEIGHFMGKRTIAEYVENSDILSCLKEIGVDYAQGFGIQKPCFLEELA